MPAFVFGEIAGRILGREFNGSLELLDSESWIEWVGTPQESIRKVVKFLPIAPRGWEMPT